MKIFPEGARFILDINYMIEILTEWVSGEVFRSAVNRSVRENSDAGIDRLVTSFDWKTYNTGKQLFLREQ